MWSVRISNSLLLLSGSGCDDALQLAHPLARGREVRLLRCGAAVGVREQVFV